MATPTTTVDRSKGNQVLLYTASIVDSTGLQYLNLEFKNIADPTSSLWFYFVSDTPHSGTSKNGKYSASVNITSTSKAGTYQVASFYISDKAGNIKSLTGTAATDYLKSLGLDSSALTFIVTGTPSGSTDLAEPVVKNLSLSTNQVDRSKGNQTLLLQAALTDSTGFDHLYLRYSNLSNSSSTFGLDYWADENLYSGNSKNGIYVGAIAIPASTSIGTYQLDYLDLSDTRGNTKKLSGTAALDYLKSLGLDSSAFTFNVTGSAPASTDLAAPVIKKLTWSTNKVDLSKGNQTLWLDALVTDSTGFDSLYLAFVNSSDSSSYLGSAHFYSDEILYPESSKNGEFLASLNIPVTTKPGTYQPSYLNITDKAGNAKNLSGTAVIDYLKSLGLDASAYSFVVSGTPPISSDTAPPVLTSLVSSTNFSLGYGPSVDVTSGKVIENIDIEFTSKNGLGAISSPPFDNWGSLTLSGPSNQKLVFGFSPANLISGTNKSGILRVSAALPAGLEAGKWSISDLQMNDLAGYPNVQTNYPDFLANESLSAIWGLDQSSLGINIVNSNKLSEYTSPSVSSIRFDSKSYDVSSGKTVGFIDIDFTDKVGLGRFSEIPINYWGYIGLSGPSEQKIYLGITPSNLISGTSKAGTLRVYVQLSSALEAGKWKVSQFDLANLGGFETKLFTPDVIGKFAGVSPNTLSVDIVNTNKSPAILGPIVSSVKFGASSYDVSSGSVVGTFDIDFKDSNGLGFAPFLNTPFDHWGTADFTGPSGQNIHLDLSPANLVSGTSKAGTLRVSTPFSQGLEAGYWTLTHLNLDDSLGYSKSTPYSNEDFIPALLQSKALGVDPGFLSVKIVNSNKTTLDSPLTIKSIRFSTTTTPLPVVFDESGKQDVFSSVTRRNSSLSDLTAAVPLKAEASKFLERYKFNDPATGSKLGSANDASFIDFTVNTGSLKSIATEIALDKEVKATAYVKVNPNTGEAFDFTYDPITGLGAELLDTNKNGLVDTLKIHLQDGAKGDADGIVNGQIRDPGVLAEAPRQSVYRFFKASKGVHLYTSSAEERANVNAHPEWGYKDEGVAYDALVTQGKALHRFFNAKASYHFMTTSDEEAKNVNAHPEWGFTDEGDSFSVSTISQVGMSTPVNRFYRVLDGVGQHFYTASADEANNIIAHPEWGYKSEGVGWYV